MISELLDMARFGLQEKQTGSQRFYVPVWLSENSQLG